MMIFIVMCRKVGALLRFLLGGNCRNNFFFLDEIAEIICSFSESLKQEHLLAASGGTVSARTWARPTAGSGRKAAEVCEPQRFFSSFCVRVGPRMQVGPGPRPAILPDSD